MNSLIVMYVGSRGCGKTLTMLKDGLQYYNSGIKIYRNYPAKFGTYISEEDILKLSAKSELYNCVIMIDEIQIFFDSRRGMSKKNLNFSYFIQQIRKRNIKVLATTQFSNTVDKRFKQHVDIQARPRYFKQFSKPVVEVTYTDVTSTEDNLFNEAPSLIQQRVTVYDPTPLFNLYNTTDLIGRQIKEVEVKEAKNKNDR